MTLILWDEVKPVFLYVYIILLTYVCLHPAPFIVHITDVHSALDQLQKLQEWLENEREKSVVITNDTLPGAFCKPHLSLFPPSVDIMLLSGDIANMPMELGADPNSPKEELERYRRDLQDVVAASSRICSNLYYIPGNVMSPRIL